MRNDPLWAAGPYPAARGFTGLFKRRFERPVEALTQYADARLSRLKTGILKIVNNGFLRGMR